MILLKLMMLAGAATIGGLLLYLAFTLVVGVIVAITEFISHLRK